MLVTKLFAEVVFHLQCTVVLCNLCCVYCHAGLVSDCRGDIRKCADYMKRAIQTAELVAVLLS